MFPKFHEIFETFKHKIFNSHTYNSSYQLQFFKRLILLKFQHNVHKATNNNGIAQNNKMFSNVP